MREAQFRLSGSLFVYRPVSACGLTRVQDERTHPTSKGSASRKGRGWSMRSRGKPRPWFEWVSVSTLPLVRSGANALPRLHVGTLKSADGIPQLQPLVAPQVLHFMQVPLRTSV